MLSTVSYFVLDVEHGFVFRRSLHREVGWFLAFQDAVDVGGGKPIQRGLINPEGDQSAFGDETAEVMGSNGAMIVPQDIKPKQTVRQDFRQCLIIAPRSSTCRVELHWHLGPGADHGRMARIAEAWDRSTAPGATSRSTISSASVRLQRLRLACRSGARLIPIRVMAGPVLAMHVFGQIYSIHFERGPPCQKK